MRVTEYIRKDGSNPYKRWFDGLDPHAASKVAIAKLRLEMGNTAAIKWLDGIGECRIDWGPGYRIYLINDCGELIILFGGGTKKTQQTDIRKAKELYAEYKSRKNTKRQSSRR